MHVDLRSVGGEEGRGREGYRLVSDYFFILTSGIPGTVGGFWNYYRQNQQGVNIAMASSSLLGLNHSQSGFMYHHYGWRVIYHVLLRHNSILGSPSSTRAGIFFLSVGCSMASRGIVLWAGVELGGVRFPGIVFQFSCIFITPNDIQIQTRETT